MSVRGVRRLRLTLRLVLAAIYIAFGGLHLVAARAFVAIVPPGIPVPETVVLLTGACEIAGGIGLLVPATRRWAGIMLAIYAVCVWPANIYQAFWHVRMPPLPDSWWYHGPRMALQPVLIWWALFAGGLLDWPFRAGIQTTRDGSRRRGPPA